jgi:Dolichyl-phosphate-mannose-protein mannosyltransferase
MEALTPSEPAPAPSRLPRDAPAWRSARFPRGVWVAAAAAYAVELAVSGRYGYQRDELYFLAAGQHLSAGYVDQPALTPLLARLFSVITGDTLVGLRLLTALGLPLMVLITASMARMLGATRAGQVIAALATACCAEYLGAFHLLTTTPVDFTFWTMLLWLIVRLLTSGDPRWWLPIGLVAGVGLSAKWNIGFLLAGFAVGLLATFRSSRPLLRSRYLLIAVGTAALLGVPDVVWQATHGWPNLGVFSHLQGDAMHNRIVYWPSQALYTSIVLVPLWLRGIRWALREARLRPVGIAAIFVIAAQFILGGKPYYPGGVYTFLFAAGVVGLERIAWSRVTTYSVAGVAGAVLALPFVPAATLAHVPLQDINSDLGEQIAWPREVSLIAQVYSGLPPAQRSVTAILADNYGEAGALDRYGPSFGLPQVYSGHNTFWWWGPPPARDTAVVAVGVDPTTLGAEFSSVRLAAVYDNGLGVSDQEQGTDIYVATGLRSSWTAAWPAFRHYD